MKKVGAATARVAADDPWAAFRVQALTSVFTGRELADFAGVSPSQPSRWASGHERPGPSAAAALIDLEHIVARTRLIWGPDAARVWVTSPNVYLGGALPIDVLRMDGPSRVLEALDGEMWGGAA
ncbi:hypothetical protein GORHZ_121_00100 [Gordonia rhizosphera NBRC 16068]|uniref:Antitoxin Xre/MbcA/ParS-like toxin-binding domain-containing protein n=1 Tax=Gordonia rhizosphera NBRC 16068 TaxID=1108045 RepID=K6WFR4_9ACTN|nr:hypothetical protein GORHZ_121_00100 [Gordonia rhizosphera NBRC 16068]